MVIEEIRSGSTLIRFDDRDIVTQEKNAEQIDLIIQFILKRLWFWLEILFYLCYTYNVDKVNRKEEFWIKNMIIFI